MITQYITRKPLNQVEPTAIKYLFPGGDRGRGKPKRR
jgi:hypothetical protein